MLPRRPLGATGIEVSLIGLGTVKIGRNTALDMAPFDLPSMGQARRLIDRARDLGVNLLDTAAAYGESEARIGELLNVQPETMGALHEGRRNPRRRQVPLRLQRKRDTPERRDPLCVDCARTISMSSWCTPTVATWPSSPNPKPSTRSTR